MPAEQSEQRKTGRRVAREVSPLTLGLFLLYLRWYMPRHFHALRVAHAERLPAGAHPLVICINHASWWDPLVILLLTRALAPGRVAYAPMEAEALGHYGFFEKIGAFPVDNRSSRAGAQFLRQAGGVLGKPGAILWMTPEGRFTDVRERPLEWKAGTAALTRHLGACTVVPLAIEYTFWNERLPEVLCSVGEPMEFTAGELQATEERNRHLEQAMARTQDELMVRAQKRDGALFTTVFAGRAGVAAVFNLWQRMKAAVSGRPYVAEHGTIAHK